MEGLRVGELASLAGVSTRAVRLYEARGLLPEPARTASGYRVYQVEDVVRLLRVRRLVELGLSLDEARAALAGEGDTDLRAALHRLDADLAAQQRELERRRTVLQGLLSSTDGHLGDSARVRRMLAQLTQAPASVLVDSRALERERRTLRTLDAVAPQAMAGLERWYSEILSDPVLAVEAARLSQDLEDLADPAATQADVDDLVDRVCAWLRRVPPRPNGEPEDVLVPAALEQMVLESVHAGMAPLQEAFLTRLSERWSSGDAGEEPR